MVMQGFGQGLARPIRPAATVTRWPMYGYGQAPGLAPAAIRLAPTVSTAITAQQAEEGFPTWAYVAIGVAGVGLVWWFVKRRKAPAA